MIGPNGIGYDYRMWAAGVRESLRLWLRVVVLCLVLQFFVFSVLAVKFVPAWWLEVSWKLQVAKLVRGLPMQPTFTILGRTVTAPGLLSTRQAHEVASATMARLTYAGKCSLVIYLLLAPVPILIRRRNRISGKAGHIRGMFLLKERTLARELGRERGLLPFGAVILPRKYEAEHVVIAGKTRVGKTVTIMQQLSAIREAGLPAVVYDFKGEYVEKFYRPGIDHIANPLDARGLKWNIFDDIENIPDISAITGSLIPPGAGAEHFWCTAAQDVLRGVIAGLIAQGKRTMEDLWQALSARMKELALLCGSIDQGAAGLKYIEDFIGKQASIVGAVLTSFVSWLEFACNGSGFSIKKWIADPQGSFIFITGRPEVETTLRPYISLLIDLLGKRLLSVPDDRYRRVYFVLDEFGNLQKLPTIKRLLTAGGSKGVIMILGFQDFAQIERTYGREDAETILNSCGTTLVLKLSDEATAKTFSGRFGETQDWEITETHSVDKGNSRDNVSYSRAKKIERLILPSEIQSLPKLEGYLLTPEHQPAKIRLKIRKANRAPARNKDFILREGLQLSDIRLSQARVEAQKNLALQAARLENRIGISPEASKKEEQPPKLTQPSCNAASIDGGKTPPGDSTGKGF